VRKEKQPLKYAADFISMNGIDKYIVFVYNSIEIRRKGDKYASDQVLLKHDRKFLQQSEVPRGEKRPDYCILY